jgi:predicted transcriptional regulator
VDSLPLTTSLNLAKIWASSHLTEGSTEVNADRIASELKGNTLRVYWFVMNASNQTVGVREAQRALKFSSPTLALYHLDKLRDLGLVSRDTNGYRLIKEVKVDVLKQ